MRFRMIGWLTAVALLGACAATGDTPVEAINPTGKEMMTEARPAGWARGLEEGAITRARCFTFPWLLPKSSSPMSWRSEETRGNTPRSLTLLDAIGKAGGQTYDAEMSTVLWIRGRQSPPGVVKINLKDLGDSRMREPQIPNLTMIPGDVLFIPDSVIVSVERFMIRCSTSSARSWSWSVASCCIPMSRASSEANPPTHEISTS